MKTVMTNNEVCHAWAHQLQDNARNTNYSLYFIGDTIYSYGSHFPIATIYKSKDQRKNPLVLFNNQNYSKTTGCHKAKVRLSMPNYYLIIDVTYPRKFSCPYYPHDEKSKWHEANVKYLINILRIAFKKHQNAKLWSRLHQINKLWIDLNNYLNFFKLRSKIPYAMQKFVKVEYPELLAKAKVKEVILIERQRLDEIKQAKQREINRIARENANKLKLEKIKELLPGWRQHDGTRLPFHHGSAYLRVNPDKERVETSQGASITIQQARLLWIAFKKIKSEVSFPIWIGQVKPWGEGRINTDKSLSVGCHRIPYSEIEYIAGELGLIKEENTLQVV